VTASGSARSGPSHPGRHPGPQHLRHPHRAEPRPGASDTLAVM